MKAKDIMTKEVITVRPEQSVEEVAKILADNRISGVPVVDDTGKLVGVVTESDLMIKARDLELPFYITLFDSIIFLQSPRRFNEELKRFTASKVKDIMTTQVAAVDEDTPLFDIARLMTAKSINRVPVVRDGKVVGIVTRNDVVRALARS
ncbi:MAG TPA: CBS domain-containing protein [Syntrophothermus lipocalidus]|nr:CBS domain-containing protein [Syntrophothermus lipocalidus]